MPEADVETHDSELAGTVQAFASVFVKLRQSLERIEDGDTSPEALVHALSELRRGERLVTDLLACAGRQQLHAAAVEPLPLLNSLASMLRRVLGASYEVAVRVDRACPACLADRDALEEALLCLVANARDAMPGGGQLALYAALERPDPEAEPMVGISVSDSGTGMPDAIQRKAAQLFFSTKRDNPLAGVGLAAASGFAQQSGGCLRIRSSPGAFTRATVYLPAMQPAG